ncbi:hypothetical protein BDBG_03834 [Blastomyces gilchristii SLH14081]|uniref:Fungal N-terminal domain-containing protein n=1 Tax=Blastomyces gilchristii (strain SLH14081) TaxID=559298 RepID=A0A179UIG1_BLAGS|nr:uncharacterized protein BDBG_03834 [Blastomyces gilchristii SLH14081]OAT07805.1 hypothetical protein BDBG_03834 [Blastomyces gilchristii SLH14081]
MAGIEGVSAIITVAQVGFALAKVLIEYIEEVKDASSRIRRVGNEIRTTSERLLDIGKLVETNPITNALSSEGIQSAVRASDECAQVLRELRTILAKGGYTPSHTLVQKEEIDISYFTKFKWPFIKFRLEVPRAELQRIKSELTLLFTSVMAISASTEADKMFYCAEIVNVEKTRKWAAMKASKARQRAIKADRKGDRESPYRGAEDVVDERILTEFMDFKEEQAIAWERKRQEEQLALLRVREDAKREAEEKERKAIETLAERESRNSATKEALRVELERLNFSSTQMKSILDNIHVDVNDDTQSVIALRTLGHDLTTIDHSSDRNPTSNSKLGSNKSNRKPRWMLWKRSKRVPYASGSPPSALISGAWDDSVLFESWVFESSSGLWCEFKENPSENWSKQDSQQFWNQYSRLPANHRTTFQNFYHEKNKPLTDQEKWTVLHLEPIKRVIRTGIFARNEEDVGLRVLATRKNMGQSSSDGLVQVPGRDEDEEVSVPPIDEPDKELLPVPPYRSAESRAKDHLPENRKHGSESSDIPPARDSHLPQRGHRSSKSRHRIVFQDNLSDSDDSFLYGNRRRIERQRNDEMRPRDRFTDHAELYRRSSEIHPRSRTEDMFEQQPRLRTSSRKPPTGKSIGERFYEREPPAFPHESEWRRIRNTGRFADDKNAHNDDAWESGRSYVRSRRRDSTPSRRQVRLLDNDAHERILKKNLEKQKQRQEAKASDETSLVLSTLNRLTTYQGNELPPRQPPIVPTNPSKAKVDFARAPAPAPDPAPVDSDDEYPPPSHGYTPAPPDRSWATSNNTQTGSDKPIREREESRQRPTHLHDGQDYRYAAPTNNTNLRGRQLVQTPPPDPKIIVSDPSPILLLPSSPGIYESPASISRAASAEYSHSDGSSGEESAHLSHRTREGESSEDDTDGTGGKVNNDYESGDDSEHDMN